MSQIANTEILVTRENATSFEPILILSIFSGRETISLSKEFLGPILVPLDLRIEFPYTPVME